MSQSEQRISDFELLERWRSGDKQSGSMLFERYYQAIERFFVNKVSAGASDLIQETFAGVLNARDRIDPSRPFRPYLFTIAYNVLRTWLRKEYSRPPVIPISEITAIDISPGPSSVAAERREQRLLLEALRRIPWSDQALLELFYWEDFTTSDIAEIMDLPRGTVKSRLQRARRRVERILETLVDSPELLESTLSDLESWAREVAEKGRDRSG